MRKDHPPESKQDRRQLEADIRACEAAGRVEKMVEGLLALSQVVLREQDTAAAHDLLKRLKGYRGSHVEAEDSIVELEDMLAQAEPLNATLEYERHAVSMLAKQGLVQKQDVEALEEALEAAAQDGGETATSLLHILHRRGYQNLMDIMSFLAEDSGIPLLPLVRFTPQVAAYQLLNPESVRYGVLAFDFLDEALMVALLNPYNERLRDTVRTESGRQCLFYLVLPTDFDATVRILNERLANA